MCRWPQDLISLFAYLVQDMQSMPKLLRQSSDLFNQLNLGIIRWRQWESRVGNLSSMQRLMIILSEISAMWPMGVQTGMPVPGDITRVSEVHKLVLSKSLADIMQLPNDTLITVISSLHCNTPFFSFDRVYFNPSSSRSRVFPSVLQQMMNNGTWKHNYSFEAHGEYGLAQCKEMKPSVL